VGADFGAFEERGEPGHRDAGGFGDFFRPAAVDDVEEQGAGGFLHVDGERAGHAEADVVLGAEDVGNFGENFGLVLADPEQFGESEVGEGGVGGEFDEAFGADFGGEPVALGLGALVGPDEGRSEDLEFGVEHDAAVHLAGEADGFDGGGVACGCGGFEGSGDGELGGAPPVVGVLLGPARVLGVDGGVVGGVRAENFAVAVDEHGARASGAYVDAEKHGDSLRTKEQEQKLNAKDAKENGCQREEERVNTVRESFAYSGLSCASQKRNIIHWLVRFVLDEPETRHVAWGDMVRMRKLAAGSAGVLAGAMLLAVPAWGQGPGSRPGPNSGGSSSDSSAATVSSVLAAQQQLSQPGPSVTPQTSGSADASYRGSIVRDKATAGVLDLTLDDAMQRGLRNNLGLVLQSANEKGASGQRLQQLQALLPTVTGQASIEVQQVNLAAYGLKFPGLNPIVGPFQVVDFRAYLTQNLVNVQALENFIAARHNFEAAKLTAQDARDLVVLTVGNAYLLCVADAARIDSVKAELETSGISLKQANDAHDAGTSPRLDVLRAQVDYQNAQQNLIATVNQFEKDKLALARVIGLPLDQKFQLVDTAPFAALDAPDADAAFQQALKQRKDLAAAAETLKGAESAKKAAWAEQLPVASFSGDFGDLGTTVAHSHGTYTATGQLSAPILQLAKTRGDALVAGAKADQAKATLSDEVQQVNADVRDSILDIQSAAKLVDATKSNVDLAREALSEAQQRFKAGVDTSLSVSQALTAREQADDQYISALYQHNVAKLALARALGVASTNYKDYVNGSAVKSGAGVDVPAKNDLGGK
jgi:outer membrane protein TolC